MKYSIYILSLIAAVLIPATIFARDHGYNPRSHPEQATWHSARDQGPIVTAKSNGESGHDRDDELRKPKGEGPLQVLAAGSRLPDCSHACGSCSPCKLVISSACASLAQSEACPVSYRCMCNDKYYPVP